ncbi:MAG: hypothetical protein Q9214_002079 [Letrouitia sp. 1 TL-2023]
MSYQGYGQSNPSYAQNQNDPWANFQTDFQDNFGLPQAPNPFSDDGRMFQDLQNLQPDPMTYNFGGYPNVRNTSQPLRNQSTYGGYGGYGEMTGPTSSSRQQSSLLNLMPSNRIDLRTQEGFPQRTSGRLQQEPFVTDLEYTPVTFPEATRPERSDIYNPGRLSLQTPPQRLDASSGFSKQRRRQGSSSQQLAAKSLSPIQSSSAENTSDSSRRPVKKLRKRYTKITSNTGDQLEYDRLVHSLVGQLKANTDSPQVEIASTESQASRRGNQPLRRPRQTFPNPDYRYKTPLGKKEQQDIQQALEISRADYENRTGGIEPPNTSARECYAFQLSELETSAFIVSEQRGRSMTSSLVSRGPWHFQIGNWMYSDVVNGIPGKKYLGQSRVTAQRQTRDQPRTRNPIQAAGSQLRATSCKTGTTDQDKVEGDHSQVKDGQHQGMSGQPGGTTVQPTIQLEGTSIKPEPEITSDKPEAASCQSDQQQAEDNPIQATDGAGEESLTTTEEDVHELNAMALMALAEDARRKLEKENKEAVSEHANPARARTQDESHDSPLSELNSDDLKFLDQVLER